MRGTAAGSFVRAVIVLGAWASSRVISSLIVTFAWPSTCADMLFSAPPKPNYKIVADCKMHFSGVFPQMPHPLSLSLAEPGEHRWGCCQPDGLSAPSSHAPPTWLNMSPIPGQTQGGFLCSVWLAWMQKVHRVLTSILLLQPCLSSLQKTITPKTCYLCRMMSQYMRKAAVLIGGRTKTVQSEHELMKGLLSPRLLSSPSWETGYTVFCQHAVSGNYGLHCCLGAQPLCLLTWCSTVLDTKHKCLARASRKYYGYARGSTPSSLSELEAHGCLKSRDVRA